MVEFPLNISKSMIEADKNSTTILNMEEFQQSNISQIFNSEWGLINGLDIDSALLDKLNCIHISEAISAQGIDDLTSYSFVQFGMGIAYGLLLLFGLFSNGSVLLAFLHNQKLRSSRNFFLLNLILTDILLCLTAIPITPWYAMTKDWTFGPILCRFVPLCNSCAVFVTSWSLTAIAFDKYMHIVVEPTRRHFSRQLAGFVTFCIWFGSILVNIPYLMSFELVDGFYIVAEEQFTHFCGKFCDEFNWASEAQLQFYGIIVLLFQFIIPMTVISYCHLRILRKVQIDMIVQNEQFRKTLTATQRTDAINRKKRVNYTLLGMVVAFVGCNVPLISVNLAKDFGKEPEFLLNQPYLCPLIAHFIAMSIVCWNPILFYWLSAKDKSRGSSANGQLMSVGGSEQQCQHSNGQNIHQSINNYSLSVSNLLRRWSRSDLPASSSILLAKNCNLMAKGMLTSTRSQQMLSNGQSSFNKERRPYNHFGEPILPNSQLKRPLIRQNKFDDELNNKNNLLYAVQHFSLIKSNSIRSNLY